MLLAVLERENDVIVTPDAEIAERPGDPVDARAPGAIRPATIAVHDRLGVRRALGGDLEDAAEHGDPYCLTRIRSVSTRMSSDSLRIKSCGTFMSWFVNFVSNFILTRRLSWVKPKRFCCSACSGVSLM